MNGCTNKLDYIAGPSEGEVLFPFGPRVVSVLFPVGEVVSARF